MAQQLRGASKGIKSEDRPSKAPRGEACLAASVEPVEAYTYEIVRRFTRKREQSQGRCIGMGSERESVNDSIAGIPPSLWANPVVQHFHAAPDAKLYEVLV